MILRVLLPWIYWTVTVCVCRGGVLLWRTSPTHEMECCLGYPYDELIETAVWSWSINEKGESFTNKNLSPNYTSSKSALTIFYPIHSKLIKIPSNGLVNYTDVSLIFGYDLINWVMLGFKDELIDFIWQGTLTKRWKGFIHPCK